MYIYKIQSLLTNQIYIGKSTNYKERWRIHKTKGKLDIGKAIQEDGENNFSFEVLLECNTPDANLIESYFIAYYDSINNGYNQAYSCNLTQENKIQASHIVDSILSNTYDLKPDWVFCDSDTPVICITTNKVFDSAIACAKYYNICSGSRVRSVCKGERASANNLTFRFLDENGDIIEPNTNVRKKAREVFVEETGLIYESLMDAIKAINPSMDRSAIWHHLQGECEHAYGYHFHYVDIDGDVLPSTYVSKSKKILVDGVDKFDSVAQAIEFYGLPYNARGAISQNARGKSSNAYGHIWQYIDD